jgi:hypothetical protein
MSLLLMAMISYGLAVLAGALGFTGLARGISRHMRIAFGVALAVACGLIVAAGATRR